MDVVCKDLAIKNEAIEDSGRQSNDSDSNH